MQFKGTDTLGRPVFLHPVLGTLTWFPDDGYWVCRPNRDSEIGIARDEDHPSSSGVARALWFWRNRAVLTHRASTFLASVSAETDLRSTGPTDWEWLWAELTGPQDELILGFQTEENPYQSYLVKLVAERPVCWKNGL